MSYTYTLQVYTRAAKVYSAILKRQVCDVLEQLVYLLRLCDGHINKFSASARASPYLAPARQAD